MGWVTTRGGKKMRKLESLASNYCKSYMTRQHEIESKCRRYSVIYRCGACDWKSCRWVKKIAKIFSLPFHILFICIYSRSFSIFLLTAYYVYDTWENNKKSQMLKGCKFFDNNARINIWKPPHRKKTIEKKYVGFQFNEFSAFFNALNVHCCTFLWCFSWEKRLVSPVNIALLCCDGKKIRK